MLGWKETWIYHPSRLSLWPQLPPPIHLSHCKQNVLKSKSEHISCLFHCAPNTKLLAVLSFTPSSHCTGGNYLLCLEIAGCLMSMVFL